MLKISEINGTEEIGLVTPTPVQQVFCATVISWSLSKTFTNLLETVNSYGGYL